MLTQTKNAPSRLVFQTQAWIAAVAAMVIGNIILVTVLTTTWPNLGDRAATATVEVARFLFRDYVLPFEIVSVLLTAAVIGAVYLARRESSRQEGDRW
jgi:NADH-quinone oxidoreductase subunit J